jgi:hypothetical protein
MLKEASDPRADDGEGLPAFIAGGLCSKIGS